MAQPIAVNVGINPSQLWSGRATAGINTLLLMNTDQQNTVMVGSSLQSIVVPIQPNGSLSVDPTENWYVQGSVAGNAPLVVVPNGQSNFLGLSEGYGNIAIPQFQSPNYDPATGVGWALFKDGTASFNQITIVIQANGIALLIYFPTPGLGNLIGSWAASAFTDQYGNTVPAGLNVNGGQLAQVGLTNPSIVGGTIFQTLLNAATITASNLTGGTSYEQTITFDSGGGVLYGYSTTVTTVTQTANGTYSQTLPAGVTTINNAFCWGAGAGGDGGLTSEGGNGGGAGEFAGESNYTPSTNPFSYSVGNGGGSSVTGGGHGGDGSDSFIDSGGVFANGGNGDGTPGTGSTNSIHHDGGSGGATSGNSGGASGGNSGNPTATGNSGLSSTGATGAASPAGQTNSGTGGSGGSNGANGNNGGSPGAGGGGAGKGGTAGNQLVKTYSPTWAASYYGPDANGGAPPNGKRTTSVLYQGGETASGGAFNGNLRSVWAYNRAQIAADFAGYTVTKFQITFTNIHSYNSSGMTWILDEFAGLPGSSPSSYPSGDFQSEDANGTIAEGSTHTYTLSTSIGQRFVTGSTNGLGLGESIAGSGRAYNVDFYGYFNTNVTITITGTQAGGSSTTSGLGSDGKVSFSYASSQAMVFALSPQAGTDSIGNAFAAGYTGPVNTFQPGSSPSVVETWHNFASPGGGFTGIARYKLMPFNCIRVEVVGSCTSTGTLLWPAIPSTYWPANTLNFTVIVNNAPARGQLNNVGVLAAIIATAGNINFCQDIPLD
jgi:hypothetical protein